MSAWVKTVGWVSSLTLLSRIFGFVRDQLLGILVGAGAAYDAYVVALTLPNLFRRLFAEGAFTQAVVPVIAEEQNKSPESYRHFLSRVLGWLTLVASLVTLAGMLGAEHLISWVAPGFVQTPERMTQAIDLSRITFPYLLLVVWVSFFSAVLNSHRHFTMPALAPVFMNLLMILFLLVGYVAWPGLLLLGVATGLLLGGVLQVGLVLLPFRRLRLGCRPALRPITPGVRRVMRLMVPGMVSGSVWQINGIVDAWFASFLSVGSISWLYYAARLFEFPLGILGVALSTVLLPTLSKIAREHVGAFQKPIQEALAWAILLGVPASVGLFVLAQPIFVTLFQYGAFTPNDVQQCGWALQAFSVALPAHFVSKIALAAHHAKTYFYAPLCMSLICLVINVIGNTCLTPHFGHVGLAMSSSVSAVAHAVMLVLHLRWRTGLRCVGEGLHRALLLMVLAALLMGAFLAWVGPEVSVWLESGPLGRLILCFGLVLGGAAVYALLLRAFRIHTHPVFRIR